MNRTRAPQANVSLIFPINGNNFEATITNGHHAYVEGHLTVNRVPVKISIHLYKQFRDWDTSDEFKPYVTRAATGGLSGEEVSFKTRDAAAEIVRKAWSEHAETKEVSNLLVQATFRSLNNDIMALEMREAEVKTELQDLQAKLTSLRQKEALLKETYADLARRTA